jgi:hypothetical protein
MDSDSAKDGPGNPAQPTGLVELRSFGDSTTAELAKACLEASGIECRLEADDCGGMIPGMDAVRGIKLFVHSSHRDAAADLLSSTAAGGESVPDESAPGPASAEGASPRSTPSLLRLAVAVIVGAMLCLLYQWTSEFGTKTYRYDNNSDGKNDETVIYRNGYLIEESYDRNLDGRLDSWNHYDSGYKRILSKADDNFDGVPDVTWRYTDGLLTSSSADTDFNGTPDVTYTYKDELCAQADWRPNGTNIITLRQVFRNGVLTVDSRDTDLDGSFDMTIRYDPFQNVIQTNAFMLLSPTSR